MTLPDELPDGLRLARTTPTFDEASVPAGLLASHRLADSVWGRLVVIEGELDFVIEAHDERPAETRRVAAGEFQVIPPAVVHHVAPCGVVRFHVEFHR